MKKNEVFLIDPTEIKVNALVSRFYSTPENYNEIKHFEELERDLKFLVMEIIGEIAFRKHIKHIEIDQTPRSINGLLPLIELPDYIDYLYKINARQKTRMI